MKPTRYTRPLTGQVRSQVLRDRAKRRTGPPSMPSLPHHSRHDHKGAHVTHKRTKKGD